MRRFLTQCLGFVLLQVGILAFLLARYTVSDSTNYLAETVAKNRTLREAGPGKIVLVGGSSAAFGFWSDRLEERLHRPVVNLGLAAGLGVEYMLAEVGSALEQGDVVVLSFEYDHFSRGPHAGAWSGQGFDPLVLQQVLTFRPEGVRCLSLTHFHKLVLDRGLFLLGNIARRGAQSWVLARQDSRFPSPAVQRGFNRWGDLTLHRTSEAAARRVSLPDIALVGDPRAFPNRAVCDHIARFVKGATARGAVVAWSFPPRPEAMLARQGELAASLDHVLREIPGLVVLDGPADHAYPPNLFFDTANHLTGLGASLRTARLTEALERELPGRFRDEERAGGRGEAVDARDR